MQALRICVLPNDAICNHPQKQVRSVLMSIAWSNWSIWTTMTSMSIMLRLRNEGRSQIDTLRWRVATIVGRAVWNASHLCHNNACIASTSTSHARAMFGFALNTLRHTSTSAISATISCIAVCLSGVSSRVYSVDRTIVSRNTRILQ